MPRNISPPIIIAGLPGSLIKNVSFTNIELKHPGGGNPQFAKISLNELDKVPEIPASYPEFSKFLELPAWGIYIRHASDIQFNNVKLFCDKKRLQNSNCTGRCASFWVYVNDHQRG